MSLPSCSISRWLHHLVRWPGRVLDELAPTDWQRSLDQANLPHWSPDDLYCPRCGISCGQGGASLEQGCAFCLHETFSWHRFVRLAEYANPVDQWVRQMKFQKQWSLANEFADRLAEKIGPSLPPGPDSAVFVPVPMHWRRRWQRGYDQTDLLTQRLSKNTNRPMARLLQRIRHTPAQSSLPPSKRRKNIQNALAISPGRSPIDWSHTTIWLIDDVKTTGATLTACANLLRQLNPKAIHVAVIAVARPTQRPMAGKAPDHNAPPDAGRSHRHPPDGAPNEGEGI